MINKKIDGLLNLITKSILRRYRSLNVRQIIRYGLVGSINISFEYIIFNVAYYIYFKSVLISNTWAISMSMLVGFLLHHWLTFHNTFYSFNQASRYAAVVALGSFLNYTILITLLQFIQEVYMAKLIEIVILSLYNFNMYKYYVYTNKG